MRTSPAYWQARTRLLLRCHFAPVGPAHLADADGLGLADGFGQVDATKASLGTEILHLTGNFIFLAGLAGIMLITKRATKVTDDRMVVASLS
ncbi:DUF6008 family protein [Micromonospora sp. RP3T]|uniref:DUF6008 family protein n=1 Tax=Micromonospora sp. RP3T TaxID=2135446 RepID=UPI000D164989|nr:DUF6008 family protein [Micromonospora sp. RP3T]PTA46453.1 hypothetical protein C8054_10365 [Micromonospora sp. RP3T]